MIKHVVRRRYTAFTTNEKRWMQFLDHPFLEEILRDTRKEEKDGDNTGSCQCSVSVHKLEKLPTLKFHYDFLDKYIHRRDFQYIFMDADSTRLILPPVESV